jgi:hypothetical protein
VVYQSVITAQLTGLPDLILCDITMPNSDGDNVRAELRRNPDAAEILEGVLVQQQPRLDSLVEDEFDVLMAAVRQGHHEGPGAMRPTCRVEHPARVTEIHLSFFRPAGVRQGGSDLIEMPCISYMTPLKARHLADSVSVLRKSPHHSRYLFAGHENVSGAVAWQHRNQLMRPVSRFSFRLLFPNGHAGGIYFVE